MHIGLLGFGVVGAGVYDWTRGRADLTVDRVLVRSSKPGIETISTHSIEDILNDPAIDTVVEVMGGLHPAYEYVTAAMERGKHVVTANKGHLEDLSTRQLVIMIFFSLYLGYTSTGVDNIAHLSGLVIGIILAIILYHRPARDRWADGGIKR